MAIVLEANYAKKLGLPGFSSHQYSVSIRAELTDLAQIQQESSRLYALLQDAVDQSIQQIGFLPDPANHGAGHNGAQAQRTNGQRNGSHHPNGNGRSTAAEWRCSDRQSALIQKIVRERNLDTAEVERLAADMFGAGVRQLDRLQASGLIDELFERYGDGAPRGNGRRQPPTGEQFQRRIATVAAQARSVSRPTNGGSLL